MESAVTDMEKISSIEVDPLSIAGDGTEDLQVDETNDQRRIG